MDLLYFYMPGDLTFVVADCDFSSHHWGWVPALHVAANFRGVVRRLRREGHAAYEFTESAEKIRFLAINQPRTEELIEVSATYRDCRGLCLTSELVFAVDEFAANTFALAEKMWPDLATVPDFQALRARAFAVG